MLHPEEGSSSTLKSHSCHSLIHPPSLLLTCSPAPSSIRYRALTCIIVGAPTVPALGSMSHLLSSDRLPGHQHSILVDLVVCIARGRTDAGGAVLNPGGQLSPHERRHPGPAIVERRFLSLLPRPTFTISGAVVGELPRGEHIL